MKVKLQLQKLNAYAKNKLHTFGVVQHWDKSIFLACGGGLEPSSSDLLGHAYPSAEAPRESLVYST